MKIKSIVFASLSFILIFSFSCNASKEKLSYGLENPKEVLSQHNAKHHIEHERGEYKQGEISIYVNGENLELDMNDGRDRALQYVLQGPENLQLLKKLNNRVITNAEVLFLPRSMVVNDKESDFRLVLYIDENPSPDVAAFDTDVKLRGVGLGRNTRSKT